MALLNTESNRIYNKEGYDEEGYNIFGYNKEGIYKETGTKYDPAGYDKYGFNAAGFNRDGVHKLTKIKYDPEGYNAYGNNHLGFNREGIHCKTKTKYNLTGFDKEGYDAEGFDKYGVDKEGYDKEGFNSYKFNREGIHKETGTKFDSRGFDASGINKETGTKFDKSGFDLDGKDKYGFNEKTSLERRKKYLMIIDKIQGLVDGTLSIEKFRFLSKLSIEDLWDIAKKSDMDKETIDSLKRMTKEYHLYDAKIEPETLANSVTYIINGQQIPLRDKLEEIKAVSDYLDQNGIYNCKYTLEKYTKLYIKGFMDLSLTHEENLKKISRKMLIEKMKKNQEKRLGQETVTTAKRR